jgi:hypothetical protein
MNGESVFDLQGRQVLLFATVPRQGLPSIQQAMVAVVLKVKQLVHNFNH